MANYALRKAKAKAKLDRMGPKQKAKAAKAIRESNERKKRLQQSAALLLRGGRR